MTTIYNDDGTQLDISRNSHRPGDLYIGITHNDGDFACIGTDVERVRARIDEVFPPKPRPLTPDDITDEMHSRAVIEARKHTGTKDALHAEIQMILKAAFAESPARPGWDALREVLARTNRPPTIDELADVLYAEGVRVPKEEQS